MSYTVFSRSCTNWKSFATARKRVIATGLSADEALAMCNRFNDNRSPDQVRRGMKYEFTRSENL